jgi:hypothetical protein
MTTMMQNLQRWQDQYLDVMARWEEPVVRFTGRAADSAARYVPVRPDWPFLAEVPSLTEFVDNQLAFRRRVVDEQAAFARSVMDAMHPVLERLEPKRSAPIAPAVKAPATEARTPTARATKARATKARASKARATKTGATMRTPSIEAVRTHAA